MYAYVLGAQRCYVNLVAKYSPLTKKITCIPSTGDAVSEENKGSGSPKNVVYKYRRRINNACHPALSAIQWDRQNTLTVTFLLVHNGWCQRW